jgi:putative ABC transport system permease protein
LIDYIGTRAGYVEVMGMRVLAGRSFSEMRQDGVMEALIDRVVANHFFPTGNPIGGRIPFGGPDTLTVVGVVEQARLYDVHEDGLGQVYVRAEDGGYRTLSFVLRTNRRPEALVPEVRSAVQRLDARLALADVRTMAEVLDDSLRQQRMSAVLIAGFSIGALLLAALGLFGVVSASVTRRRHEMAVRLALGADHGRVLRLVLGDGARLILLGVLIGVPGTYFAGRAVSGALVGVSPTDPATLSLVAVGLAGVALAACYLPARRVLGIEPARSLRQE